MKFNTRELLYQSYINLHIFSGGRRENVSLEKILIFTTGIDEEPILGFEMHPSIMFIEDEKGFVPTSSTCINQLKLPVPSLTRSLCTKECLFNLYEFTNTYFGLV